MRTCRVGGDADRPAVRSVLAELVGEIRDEAGQTSRRRRPPAYRFTVHTDEH